MVVLTAEVFFDLLDRPEDAQPILDDLIDQLRLAKQRASQGKLDLGSGGLVAHPQNPDLFGGHWWVDATDSIFRHRFEALEIDGNWHILDHKHPRFISPPVSEDVAKGMVEVWNSPSTPSDF